jgi:hypothetical protein
MNKNDIANEIAIILGENKNYNNLSWWTDLYNLGKQIREEYKKENENE